MSSQRIGGVRFRAYPADHEPRHFHAFVGDGRVVIELTMDGHVAIARRAGAARGVKESEVSKVLHLADRHFDELVRLWEKMHG